MNSKKIIAFMLSLAVLCPMGSLPMTEIMPTITANAESLDPVDLVPTDESSFTFDADTGTITEYTGTDTDVVIPSTIGGVAVTAIANGAFDGNETLTSVYIPASVTIITESAFSNCTALETVTFADGSKLTSIGDEAFYHCSSLTKITIPDSVTIITDSAFYGCEKLETVTFADGSKLTTIGDDAFYYCSSLTEITIPDSVAFIGYDAFEGCSNLKNVYFGENSNLAYIGEYAFEYCENLTSITIPASVITIDYGAFEDCTALETVTFEKGSKLTTIGKYAFECCENLTSITIPASVTTIDYGAFYECEKLETVTFAEGSKLTTIGGYAFDYCELLSAIDIPSSVTSIGQWAFDETPYADYNIDENGFLIVNNILCQYTGSSTEIKIPEGVTSISDYVFRGRTQITSVDIPNSVTSIGKAAFYGCKNLAEINIPSSVTSIGFRALDGTAYFDTLVDGLTDEDNGFVIINDVLYKYVGSSAEMIIPDGVTYIAGGILLTTGTDDSGKTVDKYNETVTSITIPSSVKYIGDSAFYCPTPILTTVTFEKDTETDAYNLETIGDYAFDSCTKLSSITIPNSVTSIGEGAFYNCQSLSSLSIYATSIGEDAFYNCSNLKSVTLQNTVTSIGQWAFESCSNLTSVKFADGSIIDYIGDYAFEYCEALEIVNIPNSVTYCGYQSFYGCDELSIINIDRFKSECTQFDLPIGVTVRYAISVNNKLENITSDNTTDRLSPNNTSSYTATLTADENYKLPDDVTITVGDTVLTDGYTFVDGVLTIPISQLTDDITIEAKAIQLICAVTPNVTNIDFDGAETVEIENEYQATLTAKDGYTLPKDITVKVGDTTLTDGYTFVDGVLTIQAEKVTGDITIEADAIINEYSVTSKLTNITTNGATTVNHGTEYKATLTAKDGYTLPKDITVKVGDTTLTDGYTFVDGVLTIDAKKVTGDITIEAVATLNENQYSVTYKLTNITTDGATAVEIGTEYKATLTADKGYSLPKDITIKVGDTTLTDGYTFVDGVLTIDAKKVTGNITIEATATLNENQCSVTYNLTNITTDGATAVENGTEYKATLTADKGYTLPKDITIKVGDTTLTDGYTFVDGVLTIDAKKVTGNITITATAEKVENSTNQSIIDLLKVKKHILGISNIEDISSFDTNKDNQINIVDFIALKKIVLKK